MLEPVKELVLKSGFSLSIWLSSLKCSEPHFSWLRNKCKKVFKKHEMVQYSISHNLPLSIHIGIRAKSYAVHIRPNCPKSPSSPKNNPASHTANHTHDIFKQIEFPDLFR